ncbi:MAG TPA: O-antigen ligase family protein [Patescibacteria group bacterium]|nr:O-antigen ligase family protein [Patescibacteria group bacterium]
MKIGETVSIRSLLDARLIVLLCAAAMAIVLLPPHISFLLIAGLSGVFLAWVFPRIAFYAWVALAPLIGWTAVFGVGSIPIIGPIVNGSIEIGVAELLAGLLFGTLLVKQFWLWIVNAPREKFLFPLLGAFLLIFFAHALSLFSPAHPDALLVIKYSFRPVLWAYFSCVFLPANVIRSKKQLLVVLAILTIVGAVFSLDGMRSLWYGSDDQTVLARAHPMSFFGVFPIGDNHNVLAEFLSFAAPVALALAALVQTRLAKQGAFFAAGLACLVAILTFARSAWISLGTEVLFLCATLWRPWIKQHIRAVLAIVLLFLPLAAYMLMFMNQSGVQSSTDSRAMLIGIAYQLFEGSPLFGVGAGTFVDRVASVWIFNYEFGAPLDSHGLFQKVLAETGLIGIAALLVFFFLFGRRLVQMKRVISERREQAVFFYLVAGTIGAFVYQVFNTTYWTSHLWLPVGLVLTCGLLFSRRVPQMVKRNTNQVVTAVLK